MASGLSVPIIPLNDAHDARLADYRNIPDADLLERRGIFIAEGRLVVERLLASATLSTRSLLLTPTALAALNGALTPHPALPAYVVPQSVMDTVAGFNIHRGALAIGERPSTRDWHDVAAGATRLVALEGIGNADNVGATFRSAAAFGAGGVLLGPSCADPLYRKAIRTSMGASLAVPFARAEPWPAALVELRTRGWVVVGLTPSSDAPTIAAALRDVAGAPIVLVAGHEGEGLSADALGACGRHARIPMARHGAVVDSLNVATAVSIALYELMERS